MEKQKLYHILYADEMRLDSLDAQLHGEVPLKRTLSESLSTTTGSNIEGGIPSVAKGGLVSSEQDISQESLEYTFRDARYFAVMKKMGINLNLPEPSLPPPDGEIHIFKGKLQIVSLSSSRPMIETLKALLSQMKKNPSAFGLPPGKETNKNLLNVESISDVILKVPAPPSFKLTMQNNETLYGPVIESGVRLPLIDQTIVFGPFLPFEWTVIGYLYPAEPQLDDNPDPGFLFQMANMLEGLRPMINPKADATFIPLLILR